MNFSLTALNSEFPELLFQKECSGLLELNWVTAKYSLTISATEAMQLTRYKYSVLQETGRIEIDGGVLNKIVLTFCDSPYLSQTNYMMMMQELTKSFYYFKNELPDSYGDDQLLEAMKQYFNGICRGSIELLNELALETLAQRMRYGNTHDSLEFLEGNDDEDESED